METNHPEIYDKILKTRELKPELEKSLKAAIAEFKKGFTL